VHYRVLHSSRAEGQNCKSHYLDGVTDTVRQVGASES